MRNFLSSSMIQRHVLTVQVDSSHFDLQSVKTARKVSGADQASPAIISLYFQVAEEQHMIEYTVVPGSRTIQHVSVTPVEQNGDAGAEAVNRLDIDAALTDDSGTLLDRHRFSTSNAAGPRSPPQSRQPVVQLPNAFGSLVNTPVPSTGGSAQREQQPLDADTTQRLRAVPPESGSEEALQTQLSGGGGTEAIVSAGNKGKRKCALPREGRQARRATAREARGAAREVQAAAAREARNASFEIKAAAAQEARNASLEIKSAAAQEAKRVSNGIKAAAARPALANGGQGRRTDRWPRDIVVKSLMGVALVVQADADWTVLRVKEEICRQGAYPLDTQRLICGGRQLKDDQSVEEMCAPGTDVHLILNLKGC